MGGISRKGGAVARAALATATALVALALVGGASAAAAIPFCPPGTGAGQCEDPEGVAVDQESGLVYVADSDNDRVQVFEEDGTPAGELGEQGPSSGPGEFDSPSQVAVDNDAGPSRGAVYVVDYGNFRVQKFNAAGEFEWALGGGVNAGSSGNPDLCTDAGPPTDVCGAGTNGTEAGELSVGIATKILIGDGPGGEVYVVDSALNGAKESEGFHSRLQRFGEDGEAAGAQCLLFDDETREKARALAVGPGGALWVGSESGERAVRRFDDGCALELEIEETKAGSSIAEYTALAVDGDGNLYSAQRENRIGPGFFRVIAKYDPSGEALGHFGYEELQSAPEGLAHRATGLGALYASDAEVGIRYLEVPGGEPIVAGSSPRVELARSVSAEVSAEINPEGDPGTTYRVKYVEKASYEEEGFAGAAESEALELEGGGFTLAEAPATIGCKPFSQAALEEGKCLKPQTAYVFGYFAENGAGESGEEAIGELMTAPPIDILATWAAEVGSEGAKLRAQVNPLGSAATGRFEYVEEDKFEESGFDEASLAPAEGEEPFPFGAGEASATAGTSITGLEPGRAYRYRLVAANPFVAGEAGPSRRLVTFAAEAAEPCPNDSFRAGAGALLPDCRAYERVSPAEKGGGDIKVLRATFSGLPAALEKSATSGDKLAYNSQQAFAGAESAPYASQYVAARGAGGWSTRALNPPRTKLILEGFKGWDAEFQHFSDDLCVGWTIPFADPPLAAGAVEGFLNLYKRVDEPCGGVSYEALAPGAAPPLLGPGQFKFELQGVSADGSKAIFKANDKIAPEGTEGETQLYGHSAQTGTRMLCVDPGGAALSGPCTAGTAFFANIVPRLAGFGEALSEDASHLYFTAGEAAGRVYLRTDPFGAGKTVDVSKAAEEAEGTTASRYRGAASDGSRALFTTGEALYEYVAETGEATRVAGEVPGVVGMSADGRRSYFVSREDLGGEAVAGEPNLYLREAEAEGPPRAVARLAEEDVENATTYRAGNHAARVSASGSHAAFMSQSPALAEAVAGADVTDAASAVPCAAGGGEGAICDAQVYVYDAEGGEGGEGELVCVSCNPSGARPLGAESGNNLSFERVAGELATFESGLYASRALAEDGSRLYFEATDRLVARDTNGKRDVYQWERVGTGGCEESSATHNPLAGGCVDLISSGQSLLDSRFIDASPEGDDVFFATLASLRGNDKGLVDIYDARAGGGFPEPPPNAPECEGEACQSPAPSPPPSTPSSRLYQGPGNLAPAKSTNKKPKRCAKGKRKVKRKGKVRCAQRKGKRASRRHARHPRRARGR